MKESKRELTKEYKNWQMPEEKDFLVKPLEENETEQDERNLLIKKMKKKLKN